MIDRSEGIEILNRISDDDYEYVLHFLKKIESPLYSDDPIKTRVQSFDNACAVYDRLIDDNPWNNEEEMIKELKCGGI